MTWEEFERIARYKVSYNTYKEVIEPMYNALPENITKRQFVKMLNKKTFALPTKYELLKAMRKEAKHLSEICGQYRDYGSEIKFETLVQNYAERFYGYNPLDHDRVFYIIHRDMKYPNPRAGFTYPSKVTILNSNLQHLEEINLF